MHPSEVNRIRKEIWRLALANQDMRLVAAAAQELIDAYAPSVVLEAGLVVLYCRSFSSQRKEEWEPRHVVDELAPEDDLHDKLWTVRNKLYGHADPTYVHRRNIEDVFGNHSYQVEYRHLNPELLPAIEAMARDLAETFQREKEARELLLREAGCVQVRLAYVRSLRAHRGITARALPASLTRTTRMVERKRLYQAGL